MMASDDSDRIRLESVRRIVSQRGRVADEVRPTLCVYSTVVTVSQGVLTDGDGAVSRRRSVVLGKQQ